MLCFMDIICLFGIGVFIVEYEIFFLCFYSMVVKLGLVFVMLWII